jgi:hypothetical protein
LRRYGRLSGCGESETLLGISQPFSQQFGARLPHRGGLRFRLEIANQPHQALSRYET